MEVVIVEVTVTSGLLPIKNRIYIITYFEYHKILYLTKIHNVIITAMTINPVPKIIRKPTKHGFHIDL